MPQQTPTSFNRRRLPAILLIAVLCFVLGGHAIAKFAIPPDAPVTRLIKNVTAYTKEHPSDPEGYYTLARVNYLAFSLKKTTLRTFDGNGTTQPGAKLPRLPDDSFQQGSGRVGPGGEPQPTDEEVIAHLKAAIENYGKAIEMDPKNGLYRLGLACILEQGSALAEKVDLIPRDPCATTKPTTQDAKTAAKFEALIQKLGDNSLKTRESAESELRSDAAEAMDSLLKHVNDKDAEIKARVAKLIGGYWKAQAIPEYLEAYKLAISKDLKIGNAPMFGLKTLVGYEAGLSYIRLVKEREQTAGEKEQVAKIEADLKTLDAKPPGPITPIVFSLERPAALADLIDPTATVTFNLDGTGRTQRWNWVKPDTGILVWDPKGTGEITSGWQLFGSVSFFMFWSNGYRALDALDDNRDGRLDGAELKGLAVWFDRNSNGRSDAGEVVPVEELGIKSITVRATGKSGQSPGNSTGLQMNDGRVLPTYDWIASPASSHEH